MPCIDLEALRTVEPSAFFRDRCLSLRDPATKAVIDGYQAERRRRYGYAGLLPAEYAHEYHRIKSEWQRKVATVGVGDDVVTIVLKHVQMFQHIYKRLEGLPISATGNTANEQRVFDAVRGTLCLKCLGNDEEAEWMASQGLRLDTRLDTYNYYAHVPSNLAKVGSNKWKTKQGVNRLLRDRRLTCRTLTAQDAAVETISHAFLRWKREVEKTRWLSKGMAKAITTYPYWNDPALAYYLFEYGDDAQTRTPIGLVVYLLVNERRGYQLVNKGIAHMVFEDAVAVPNEVRQRLGAYMHYVTMRDLCDRGVVDTLAGGAMETRKASLGIYKAIMNDRPISAKVYHAV
jgi:hypothetical protein